MAQCKRCLRQSLLISKSIGLCLDCIRQHCDELESAIERVHSQTRQIFGLPEEKPRHPNGVSCRRCVNECCIYDGSRGLCGLRANRGGKLVGGGPREGNLSHYYDPLPTNCVADWVCPGGSPRGYPRYSYRPGPEYYLWEKRSPNRRARAREGGEAATRTLLGCNFTGDSVRTYP